MRPRKSPRRAARKGLKPERPQEASARERAKAETRNALIEAGVALIAEQGLDVPSLDAICDRAGYTRGAFYVHFRDRDAFIVAVMDHLGRRVLDLLPATGQEAWDLTLVARLF